MEKLRWAILQNQTPLAHPVVREKIDFHVQVEEVVIVVEAVLPTGWSVRNVLRVS